MSAKNPLIFIVEDNPIYNQLLEEKLLTFGYDNIMSYFDAKDCILNLNKNPDIVIIDYHLGEDTGYDVLKAITKNRIKTQMIFLSGNDDCLVSQDALTSGAYAYILKDQNAFENLRTKLDDFKSFWLKS